MSRVRGQPRSATLVAIVALGLLAALWRVLGRGGPSRQPDRSAQRNGNPRGHVDCHANGNRLAGADPGSDRGADAPSRASTISSHRRRSSPSRSSLASSSPRWTRRRRWRSRCHRATSTGSGCQGDTSSPTAGCSSTTSRATAAGSGCETRTSTSTSRSSTSTCASSTSCRWRRTPTRSTVPDALYLAAIEAPLGWYEAASIEPGDGVGFLFDVDAAVAAAESAE